MNIVEIAPRISVDEKIRFGKPGITGIRVPVDLILGKLAGGMAYEEVMAEYEISRKDILAVLNYAAKTLSSEEITTSSFLMIKRGDVISYSEMCREEGINLQKGMNFRLRGKFSVHLMSLRPDAPYLDRLEEDGKVLIYEGHGIPKRKGGPDPKMVDQPAYTPKGTPTQNGLFWEAAMKYKWGDGEPELVKVYEKIRTSLWVYNGLFKLVDTWQEMSNTRKVYKFKLELDDDDAYFAAGAVPNDTV